MNTIAASSHSKFRPKKIISIFVAIIVINSMLLSSATSTQAWAALEAKETGAQTVSGPTVLQGMDEPPPADQAVVADKNNPAWVTHYGTQAGRKYLPPRQATFEVKPHGPAVTLGAWDTWDLTQVHTVNAVLGVPDGRVFAAIASNGLRVYAPTSDGSYAWSEIHATFNGLASENVTCLAYLDGTLYVGTTDSGVSMLNLADGTWSYFHTSDGLASDYILRITTVPYYLPDHEVWFSTSQGATRYYFDGFNAFWGTFQSGNTVFDTGVQIIGFQEYDWVLLNTSVQLFDGSNWTTYSTGNTGSCNMWSAQRVVIDPSNTVWFASQVFVPPAPGKNPAPNAVQDASGLCTYNNGTWTPYNSITPGLPSDLVSDLAVDGAGRVWIGTRFGAAVYDQGTWLIITQANGYPIFSDDIISLNAVGETVWFGHYNEVAFSQYAPNWQRFNATDMGNAGAIPKSVLVESANTWVGLGAMLDDWDGIRWTTVAIPGNTSDIISLARDGGGTLWIGTAGNGLYADNGGTFTHQGTSDGLPGNTIRALLTDHAGRLWVGTDGGLALRGNGYWLSFDTSNSGLTSNDIRALANDSTDRIWIGTGDQGINILTTNTQGGVAWSTQTTSNGLPSNTVNALATDPGGVVWAATAGGLASWDPTTTAWTTQIAEQSLSVASDPQGRIWAGTVNALYLRQGGVWLPFHATGSMLGGDHVIALASDGNLLWALSSGITAIRGVLTGPIGFFAPAITSFNPTQGAVGDIITINGSNFDDRDPSFNQVLFGDPNNSAQSAQVLSASSTQLTVQVPYLALTGLIYVRAHGLAGQSADTFTVTPKVTSVTPACMGIGSTLSVWGTGFTASNNTLFIQFGAGPWRQADVWDPSLIQQILRPGDLSGAVSLRVGLTGPVYTSSATIGLSQPEVTDTPVIQQGVQGEQMVWGKRTLIILPLKSTGSGCNAQVNGGYIEWKLKSGSPYKDSDSLLPNPWGMQIGSTTTGTALSQAAAFVLGINGIPGELPGFTNFDGVRIHLLNGPVELLSFDIPASSFNFVNTGSRHQFLNIAVLPSTNYSDAKYKTFLANTQQGLENVARVYPQQDISALFGSEAWMTWGYATFFWDTMIDLSKGDDGPVRAAVDDYRNLINDNGKPYLDQAMAIVDDNLRVGNFTGIAQISCADPFGDCNRNTSLSFSVKNELAPTYLQESIHVSGWVDGGSPNYADYNPYHSKYDEGRWSIPANCNLNKTFRQALVDQIGSATRVMTLNNQARPVELPLAGCDPSTQAKSVMSYVPLHVDLSSFLEPVDYSHILNWILSNDNSDIGPFIIAPDASQTLRLDGVIDQSDVVTVTQSYLMGAGGLLSNPAAEGSYALVLLDAANHQLSSQHFSLPTGETHGSAVIPGRFSLHVAFPAGAVKAEILHNTTVLWTATVSAHAPTVSFTSPNGGSYNAASAIPVAWSATDADGDPLKFSLAYSKDGGTTWVQVAADLTGSSFSWTPGFIPASTQARLRITASDGFNTGSAVSNPFTLTARGPFAFIISPAGGATFTEGETAFLEGGSMTPDGTNQGNFSWTLDGDPVPLGTTRDITATLNSVGVHTLDLQVTSNGLADTSSITLTVKADYDHDGMPNDWELKYKLNPLDPSDAFADPDGDGLTNLREYQLGTNPIVADTDGDGAPDGAEVAAGTDPLRADQKPASGLVLSVGADTLGWTYRIGSPSPTPWQIWVTNSGTGSLGWTASSDAAWLSATPGSGTAPTGLTISANVSGLTPGVYTGHITLTASGASGSPHTITVTLNVFEGKALQSVYLPVVGRP